jgi:hypothetical protein
MKHIAVFTRSDSPGSWFHRIPTNALFAALLLSLFGPGCATYERHGLEPAQARQIEQEIVCRPMPLSGEMEAQILALNPEHVTDEQVRGVLSQAPAPRVFNIHGGIFPVHRRMISFSEFLVGMGYPRDRIQNPGDGTYTFSCYESSERIAGIVAWYYERDGLRSMVVGHSQGAMQAVKLLHKLAGRSVTRLPVWNPLTWKSEERYEITDPLTGERRPVVGLQLSYVTGVGGGGLTRLLPNQWDMAFRLRKIPDSTTEFTGFYKRMDLLGGDYLGYGSANEYKPLGTAKVRNIRLPTAYHHGAIPDTEHLLRSRQIRDWINQYNPADELPLAEFDSDSVNVLWAADVWYSVKKHWVLELQHLIRAKHTHPQKASIEAPPKPTAAGSASR